MHNRRADQLNDRFQDIGLALELIDLARQGLELLLARCQRSGRAFDTLSVARRRGIQQQTESRAERSGIQATNDDGNGDEAYASIP